MKKHLITGALASIFLAAQVNAVPITTQIITIMDESGSMSNEQAWIDDAMIALDASLLALAGNDIYDGTFGLVGYGGNISGQEPRKILVGGNDLGTVNEFSTATQSLRANGFEEDGFEAIDFVFDNYNVGNGLTSIFLVTDEDRDNTSTDTYASILNQLVTTNTLLNSVAPCRFFDTDNNEVLGIDAEQNAYRSDGSGGFLASVGDLSRTSCAGSAKTDYVELAFASGGASWSITQLRNNPNVFTTAFVNTTGSTVVSQPKPTVSVSTPATTGLIGLSLGILAFRRKIQ